MTSKSTLLSWSILFFLMIIWGSSFILIKRSLTVFSPEEVGALRIVITFLALFPLALLRVRQIRGKTWLILAITGLLGSGLPPFLFARAQVGIDSNLAGILNSLTPLFTLLFSLVFFRFSTRWYNMLGVFIGLGGAVGLLQVSGGHEFTFNFTYALYVILATMCYAMNVNLIKAYLKEIDAISITAFTFFILGLPVLLYLLIFTDFTIQLTEDPAVWQGLGYMAVLALAGTALALILFNRLIKISTPLFASSVTYLIPVVAVMWGIIDGEIFEIRYLIWMAMILGGVFLVNRK
jgi:drug/metabolite transporter (DMT)-like permease